MATVLLEGIFFDYIYLRCKIIFVEINDVEFLAMIKRNK